MYYIFLLGSLFLIFTPAIRNPGDPAESCHGRRGRAQSRVHQVQQASEHGAQAVPGENTVIAVSMSLLDRPSRYMSPGSCVAIRNRPPSSQKMMFSPVILEFFYFTISLFLALGKYFSNVFTNR